MRRAGGRDGVADDLGQLDRWSCTGRAATMARAMRLAKRSSPKCAQHAGQLALVVGVDDVGRGRGRSAVHAHVERGVLAVAEAAVGPVELRRADPEVEEHADDRVVRAGDGVGRDVDRGGRSGTRTDVNRPGNSSASGAEAASASSSWSMPTTRRCGWASSSARAWPPPPRVASTSTPAGTGANSSVISSTITGRCGKPWSVVSCLRACRRSLRRGGSRIAHRQPFGQRAPVGMSPRSGWMGSGRSRGLPSCRPKGCE